MRWPLRRQILLPLLAVAVVSLAAVGAINARLAAQQARIQVEQRLQGVVAVLTTTNFPLSDNVLRQMRELSSAEFVLADDSERILASSLLEPPSRFPQIERQDLPSSPLGPSLSWGGTDYFHRGTPLPARSVGEPLRMLHVLFPVSEYDRTWREAFIPPLIVGVITVAAVATVAQLIAGRLSRAAARLQQDVLRIATGDFAPAELPVTNDEIRDLSLAVNRTAEMLADYEQQVRRTEQMRTIALLGAGLAHEMRNAATGCRIALDLHAELCDSQDNESLFVAKRQLRLMESQLQRFLRAGKPLDDIEKREVSFSALVDDSLSLIQPSARHARVELAWNPPPSDLLVMADPEALGQVVLNLLINAIEAVQRNGDGIPRTIEISLQQTVREEAELSVRDSGPGPKNSVDSGLFDPFVTSKAEGVGLGLAVARQIVEAHVGSIGWSRAGETTTFRVVIPLFRKGVAGV